MRVSDGLRRLLPLACFGLLLVGPGAPAIASEPGRDAQSLMAAASARAQAEGKGVLLEFGGSPCIWCRKLDELLEPEPVGRIIGENYVVLKLSAFDSNESGETPGAQEAMNALGPTQPGVPFYVFLTADGRKVADWFGFPPNTEEVDKLLQAIAGAAPRLDDAQRKLITRSVRGRFRRWAREHHGFVSWGHLRAYLRAELIALVLLIIVGILASWFVRHRHGRRSIVVASVVAAPIIFAVAVMLAEGGRAVLAWAAFALLPMPFTLDSRVVPEIGARCVLALVQIPIYGLILQLGHNRGLLKRGVVVVGIVHIALVGGCMLLTRILHAS